MRNQDDFQIIRAVTLSRGWFGGGREVGVASRGRSEQINPRSKYEQLINSNKKESQVHGHKSQWAGR